MNPVVLHIVNNIRTQPSSIDERSDTVKESCAPMGLPEMELQNKIVACGIHRTRMDSNTFTTRLPSLPDSTFHSDFGGTVDLSSICLRAAPRLLERQKAWVKEFEPPDNLDVKSSNVSTQNQKLPQHSHRLISPTLCQHCHTKLPCYHAHSSVLPGTASHHYTTRFSLRCQECLSKDSIMKQTLDIPIPMEEAIYSSLEDKGTTFIYEEPVNVTLAMQKPKEVHNLEKYVSAVANVVSHGLQKNPDSGPRSHNNQRVFEQTLEDSVGDCSSAELTSSKADIFAGIVKESPKRGLADPVKGDFDFITGQQKSDRFRGKCVAGRNIPSHPLGSSTTSRGTNRDIGPGETSDQDVFKGLQIAMAAACDPEIDAWIREISGYRVRNFLSSLRAFDGLGIDGLSRIARKTAGRRSTRMQQALGRLPTMENDEQLKGNNHDLGPVAVDEAMASVGGSS
jgi:hypothetical protein